MFGECQNKWPEQGRNLHVRDSFLPFPPSREVARVRVKTWTVEECGEATSWTEVVAGQDIEDGEQSVFLCQVVVEEAFTTIEQVNSFYCSQPSNKLRLPMVQGCGC